MHIDFEWDVRQLDSIHKKREFDCGDENLNQYLRLYAGQHAKLRINQTFVASPMSDPSLVLGYVTISMGAVARESVDNDNKLPYHPIPVIHIGRLAVSTQYQSEGILGPGLLGEVYMMAIISNKSAPCYAMDVVAKNQRARHFYERNGFKPLQDNENHLWLRVKDIIASLER